MIHSGVAVRDAVEMPNDEDMLEDVRIHIIVHSVTPPFLAGSHLDIGHTSSMERDIIMPVKDPNCDFVKTARYENEEIFFIK